MKAYIIHDTHTGIELSPVERLEWLRKQYVKDVNTIRKYYESDIFECISELKGEEVGGKEEWNLVS